MGETTTRSVPETVTIRGETAVKLLGTLDAVMEIVGRRIRGGYDWFLESGQQDVAIEARQELQRAFQKGDDSDAATAWCLGLAQAVQEPFEGAIAGQMLDHRDVDLCGRVEAIEGYLGIRPTHVEGGEGG